MTPPSHTRRSDPDGGLRPRRECCDNNMATLFLSVFLDNNLNIRTLQFPSRLRSSSTSMLTVHRKRIAVQCVHITAE